MPTDAPYLQSRSALRAKYGARRINATAPQSAADMTPSGMLTRQKGIRDLTPSGRQRSMRQGGMSEDDIVGAENRFWNQQFGGMNPIQNELTRARPVDMLRRRSAPMSPIDAMSQFGDDALLPVGTTTPYKIFASAGPAEGVDPAIASLFPSARRRNRPSILDGAQTWLRTV